MALSLADFYAYSRATGVPVPEDPAERAQMAMEVADFRRNQLKGQPEGPNLLATLGLGAAAIGGAVGLGLAGRRLLRGPAKSATAGVTQADLSRYAESVEPIRRAAAQETVVVPQETAATPGTPVKSSGLPDVRPSVAPPPPTIRPRREAKGFSPREYVESTGSLVPTDLTSTHQATAPLQADQFINAVESGEDQMTGRIKQQLQRNEDLDLSQVEVLENIADENDAWMRTQDEPINTAASQLPDGIPQDQAEGVTPESFAQKQVNQQRVKREQLLDVEYKMYDMVASAAEKGVKMDPKRALQIITNPTVELNQEEMSLFRTNPNLGKFALRGQTFEPGQQQTGAAVSIGGERLRSIPNIGMDPQSPIKQAASGTSIRGRSRVQNEPDQFRPRVSSSGRPVENDVFTVDEGGTVTVYPGEELTELETNEGRSSYPQRFIRNIITGERQEEYAPKNMRPIQTAEGKTYFVPTSDPGGVGIYGVERQYAGGPISKYDNPAQGITAGSYTKTAMRAPTELPFKEKTQGGAGFSGLSTPQLQTFIEKAPEGRVRLAGEKEMQRRQASQQSLQVSEALRRANIEGRDPNKILREFGFNL
jgi:hypothetical protein